MTNIEAEIERLKTRIAILEEAINIKNEALANLNAIIDKQIVENAELRNMLDLLGGNE